MTRLIRELRELNGDPVGVVSCGGCGRDMHADVAEYCWYCSGPLCGDCWERVGHCGHAEAYRADENIRIFPRKGLTR